MKTIINKIAKEKNILDEHLSSKEIDEYLEILDYLKEEELYESKVHGLYHSQKVCLFAFILAKKYKLNEEDMKIVMDAALYHDVGRDSDCQDEFHGLASALKIVNIVDDKIYDNNENYMLLQAIVDNHSRQENRTRDTYENYIYNFGIKSSDELYKRYLLLNAILKDADALDRNRFAAGYSYSLDEKYLHLSESKKLIELSKKVNQIYTEMTMVKIDLSNVEYYESDCFHSIGYDFFKLKSCLENGILSESKLEEKNIKGVKNFDGGNSKFWISVVDKNLVGSYTSAFKEFTLNGINFVCTHQSLVAPLQNSKRSLALETGLPYDKSGYSDERYVLEEIKPNDISCVTLYAASASKKLNEALFVYNSFNYESFVARIEHYIKETDAIKLGYNHEQLNELLKMYKEVVDEYISNRQTNNYNFSQESLINKLTELLSQINSIIQNMVMKYYERIFHKPGNEIRIYEIVEYELSKSNNKFEEYIYDDKVEYKKR